MRWMRVSNLDEKIFEKLFALVQKLKLGPWRFIRINENIWRRLFLEPKSFNFWGAQQEGFKGYDNWHFQQLCRRVE